MMVFHLCKVADNDDTTNDCQQGGHHHSGVYAMPLLKYGELLNRYLRQLHRNSYLSCLF